MQPWAEPGHVGECWAAPGPRRRGRGPPAPLPQGGQRVLAPLHGTTVTGGLLSSLHSGTALCPGALTPLAWCNPVVCGLTSQGWSWPASSDELEPTGSRPPAAQVDGVARPHLPRPQLPRPEQTLLAGSRRESPDSPGVTGYTVHRGAPALRDN